MENPIPVSEACPDANYLEAELVCLGCPAKTAQQCVSMWIRTWKDSVSFNDVVVIDEVDGFPDWLEGRLSSLCERLQEGGFARAPEAALAT